MRLRRELNLGGPIPLPLLGNLLFMIRYGINGHAIQGVRRYGKNFVLFAGGKPMVYTADETLVKNVTIKDFRNFTNLKVI